MWLYLIVAALVVLGLVGGAFAGGIFTIVLLPIAAIVLIAGLAYTSLGRGAEQKQNAATPEEPGLPHNVERSSGHAPTSPEALADSRRVHQ
jgi:hypothetical protein